jgi:general secretion pathway protein D
MKNIAKSSFVFLLAATVAGCSTNDLASGLDTAGPRLYSPNRNAEKGYINSRAINDTAGRPTYSENGNYEASLNEGDARPVITGPDGDQADETGVPGGRRFKPGEKVTLKFDNEPLSKVVQRMLGGILRVNYVAPPDLKGSVTFKTETPIPADQVLMVVRDLLARNNLSIRRVNNVYHIGTADQLNELQANSNNSQLEDATTKVIQLPNGRATEFARVISSLVPPGTQVSAIESSNSLLVKGRPEDFESVRSLIDTLVQTGVVDQRIAIVPLREAAPEQVAEQIMKVYSAFGTTAVMVIPLESRQALLIAANSNTTINNIRRLVRQLDVNLTEKMELRVVQLTNLNAKEVAEEMTKLFGGEVAAVENAADAAAAPNSNIVAAAKDLANQGVDARMGVEQNSSTPAASSDPKDGVNYDPAAAGENSASATTTSISPGSDGISIVANERSNSLLIRSSFKDFKRIKEVVSALDVPAGQVVIEATILEVTINDRLRYGVQTFLKSKGLSLRSAELTAAADPGNAGFTGVFSQQYGSVNIGAVVDALKTITTVKIVSSPYLTVTNNKEARLAVGDQIPYTKNSQTSNSGGAVTVTQEVETRDTGIILKVTPLIRPDNSVTLDISQEVSTPREEATGDSKGANPVIAQRSIVSQITVDSGATALLGGLIQDRMNKTKNGVPVLGDVPVLGTLFSQTNTTQARTELVVLITPRVVRRSNQLEYLTEQLRWQTSIRPSSVVKK